MKKLITLILLQSLAPHAYSAPERSGPGWCERFPGSAGLTNSSNSFYPKIKGFLDALWRSSATVHISSGHRPEQRQYLMYWCWRIAREGLWLETTAPCGSIRIPEEPQVTWYPPNLPTPYVPSTAYPAPCEIIWAWPSPLRPVRIRNCTRGCPGHLTSRGDCTAAAGAMVQAFRLRYGPGRESRHVGGRAVDLAISWSGDLTIRRKDGKSVTITSLPRNGENLDLHRVGATYGVHKLVADPPHWSEDGH
jgi:hypothetical protein